MTTEVELTQTGRPTVWCQASMVGAGMTVNDIVGEIYVGLVLYSPEFEGAGSVTVTAFGTGTGGVGGYTVDPAQVGIYFADMISSLAGTMSGNTLTITGAGQDDALEVGTCIFGTGIPDNTYITALGTGTGGTGTYTVSTSATVAAVTPLETRHGWQVPADWSETNTVEAVGAGGLGGTGWMPASSFSRGGGGGGSGGYAANTITDLTPGSYVPYQVGKSLNGESQQNSADSGNATWFNIKDGLTAGTNCVAVRGGGVGDGAGFGLGGAGGGVDQGTGFAGAAGGDGFSTTPEAVPVGGGGGGGAPWGSAGTAGTASPDALGGAGGNGVNGAGGVIPGGDGSAGVAPNVGGGGGAGGSSTSKDGGDGGAKGAGGGGAGGNALRELGVRGVGADGYIFITYDEIPIPNIWHTSTAVLKLPRG